MSSLKALFRVLTKSLISSKVNFDINSKKILLGIAIVRPQVTSPTLESSLLNAQFISPVHLNSVGLVGCYHIWCLKSIFFVCLEWNSCIAIGLTITVKLISSCSLSSSNCPHSQISTSKSTCFYPSSSYPSSVLHNILAVLDDHQSVNSIS